MPQIDRARLRQAVKDNRISSPSIHKFFDARLNEWDDENYYLEREWRTSQDVEFSLNDVWRVILPPEFTGQFRKDFKKYDGEVVFS